MEHLAFSLQNALEDLQRAYEIGTLKNKEKICKKIRDKLNFINEKSDIFTNRFTEAYKTIDKKSKDLYKTNEKNRIHKYLNTILSNTIKTINALMSNIKKKTEYNSQRKKVIIKSHIHKNLNKIQKNIVFSLEKIISKNNIVKKTENRQEKIKTVLNNIHLKAYKFLEHALSIKSRNDNKNNDNDKIKVNQRVQSVFNRLGLLIDISFNKLLKRAKKTKQNVYNSIIYLHKLKIFNCLFKIQNNIIFTFDLLMVVEEEEKSELRLSENAINSKYKLEHNFRILCDVIIKRIGDAYNLYPSFSCIERIKKKNTEKNRIFEGLTIIRKNIERLSEITLLIKEKKIKKELIEQEKIIDKVLLILNQGSLESDKRFIDLINQTIVDMESYDMPVISRMSIQFVIAKKYIEDIIKLKEVVLLEKFPDAL